MNFAAMAYSLLGMACLSLMMFSDVVLDTIEEKRQDRNQPFRTDIYLAIFLIAGGGAVNFIFLAVGNYFRFWG